MAAEPRPAATTARYVVLGGLVLLAAVPLYVYLEPQWRALVSRLAAALVLGMALLELRGILAGRVAHLDPSALDAARTTPAPEPAVPQRLLELTASATSRGQRTLSKWRRLRRPARTLAVSSRRR